LNFTKLSNRCEQPSHSQKFRISSPLPHAENSRDSGAIMSSPHFGQHGLPKYRSWKYRIGAATWSVMTNFSVLVGAPVKGPLCHPRDGGFNNP
jgi:hypothetical protein